MSPKPLRIRNSAAEFLLSVRQAGALESRQ